MKTNLLKLKFALLFVMILSFQFSFSQLTLIDVAPGPDSSFATDLEAVGTATFFAAIDSGGDAEPHVFDPSFGAMAMKIDINSMGSSFPASFTEVGGDKVFFTAEDETGDRELYVIDIATGIPIKIDVDPAGSSDPTWLANIDGVLFFTATVAGDKEAYLYDGTLTKIDVNPAGSSDPEEFTFAAGFTFFIATVVGDKELYKFDGSLTKIDINTSGSGIPTELTEVGDNLYFNAESTSGDKELHFYDTTADTVTEIDVWTSGSSSPFSIYNGDGLVYFTAVDSGDAEMYEYDPATDTLSKIDINPGGSSFPAIFPGNYLKVGIYVYCPAEIAGDRELYKFDTTSGMVTKIDVNPSGPSAPLELTEMQGNLYFTADDPSIAKELYKYDGATLTFIDLNSGGSGEPGMLTVVAGSSLMLAGTNGMDGFELFEWIDPTLSIEDSEVQLEVNMFPNPIKNSQLLSINISNGNILERIEIYSISGALIEKLDYQNALSQIEIPVSNYASGIYLVHIITTTGSTIKKLVVD